MFKRPLISFNLRINYKLKSKDVNICWYTVLLHNNNYMVIVKGNGNPLQYSCLENYMDIGAWGGHSLWGSQRVRHDLATKQQINYYWLIRDRAPVHGVAKSQTWLSDWTEIHDRHPRISQFVLMEPCPMRWFFKKEKEAPPRCQCSSM